MHGEKEARTRRKKDQRTGGGVGGERSGGVGVCFFFFFFFFFFLVCSQKRCAREHLLAKYFYLLSSINARLSIKQPFNYRANSRGVTENVIRDTTSARRILSNAGLPSIPAVSRKVRQDGAPFDGKKKHVEEAKATSATLVAFRTDRRYHEIAACHAGSNS